MTHSLDAAARTLPEHLHPDTLALHTSIAPSAYGENSEALYLTSCFVQPNAATSALRFAGEEDGYTYSRTSNPSVSAFEQRLAALEGAEAAIGTASGMAAKASVKAAGAVIDDAAVTPKYVHGFDAKRELPIIWKIARGSLFNKIIISSYDIS